MAHGLTGNKLVLLAPYAKIYASNGYAVLLFDYRRRGTSDGSPMHVLAVEEQLEDYRTVIEYAKQQSEFEGHRLILWGTSFPGGHTIALASENNVNAAVICSSPFSGGALLIKFSVGLIGTTAYAVASALKQLCGFGPIYVPVAARPGCIGAFVLPGALEGLLSLVVNEE